MRRGMNGLALQVQEGLQRAQWIGHAEHAGFGDGRIGFK
jgi:hypothetical protein